jgi:hypothetical protein
LLHGVLIAALLFSWTEPAKQPPKDIVEIEILPDVPETLNTGVPARAKSKPPGKNTAGNSSPPQGSATEKKALAQKLLGSSYHEQFGIQGGNGNARPSGSWEEGGYTTKDDSNVAWGAGSGTFERIQDLSIMSRFHQKVDALLFYPGILARHKVSGVVNARIVLDQNGDCDWEHAQIRAGEPHLRLFVMHILKNVCDENFKKYLGKRERTNIDMSFQFSISEQPTTEELIRQNQKVVGNVLLFFRNSHQSVAEWHFGPFAGMFPFPVVSLDFDWIQENIEKYIDHKNPMGEYIEKPGP